jgi:hypothetical protein
MTSLALTLQLLLPPIDVAGLLAGAAVSVLRTTYGADKAAEYVAEMAAEMSLDRMEGEQTANHGRALQ